MPTKQIKMGAPTKYNKIITDEICYRLISGESLRSITRDETMPSLKTVYNWLKEYPDFLHQYQQARDEQIETYADEIIEIADDATNDFVEKKLKSGEMAIQLDNEHVLRSRLRIDTRKWIAERMKPKKYGNKLEIESIEHKFLHIEFDKLQPAELAAEANRVQEELAGIGSLRPALS